MRANSVGWMIIVGRSLAVAAGEQQQQHLEGAVWAEQQRCGTYGSCVRASVRSDVVDVGRETKEREMNENSQSVHVGGRQHRTLVRW